jgi:hypothetical protein
MNTKKKESNQTRPIRRINLSLPVVQTESYEIYYTVPQSQIRQASNSRPISRQKPLIDNKNINKPSNHPPKVRSPGRLKHVTAPVLVNLFVDMPPMPTDSALTMADNISNALINSGYSEQTLQAVQNMSKRTKHPNTKDDGDRSQKSSVDRLLYESLGSFEDPHISKTKKGMWQNIHHPQLTTVKVLHRRRTIKRRFAINDTYLRVPHTSSLENLSQASLASSNDYLYDKIEHLTRNYFPTIQQLRHYPCPELIHNRMHLHREEKRDFVPVFSRSRVDP